MVQDVLQATIEVLGRQGYAALRVDEVAALAGVNKTTVYRRWPTKLELVSAAFHEIADRAIVAVDTGSLRSDLLAFFRARSEASSPARAAMIRLITTERANPEVAALARSRWEEHLGRVSALVERGVDRGELPAGTDAALVAEVIASASYVRFLQSGQKAEGPFLEAVIDLVLRGAVARPNREDGG
ncbi:Transcriptional regulator, TetR family [Vulgatibacter incomptus]|uniref:Transcriptional regulator, TetR family n=1 Tax=Vulgatibacter incomptus TaxID=1391653 RepID=A0A0K1PD60_9BACT|nr:Transcriptional regulator, TetR family [Vulgatibacter incomptus]